MAAYCLYQQVDETIRAHVHARFAEHYRGLKVEVRSAIRQSRDCLVIRGISIVEPGAEGPRAELLFIEELRLACNTDLSQLASGEPNVSEVIVRRPTLWVTRRADGGWGATKLLPWPTFGCHPPVVKVEGGTIEIFDPQKTPVGTFTVRDVNLSLIPQRSTDAGQPDGRWRRLQGTMGADHLRQVAVEGLVDSLGDCFNISGSIDGLEVSPELRESLPDPLSAKMSVLGALRGQSEFSFRLSKSPQDNPPFQFSVAGKLARGRFDDPRWPAGLSDIRASFRADTRGYEVEELAARSSSCLLRLSCRGEGYEPTSPAHFAIQARQLELDRRLVDSLPDNCKEVWYKYLPSGHVDIDAKLEYDGQSWSPEVSVGCQNVSFSYHKFPFRLECARGTLELKEQVLRLALMAQSGNQPVRLSAEIQRPLDAATGWFEAKAAQLPIDDKLISAVPERGRAVLRSLDPHGTCGVQVRLWRERADEPMHRHLVATLQRCALRFDKFPYPLSNIHGEIEMLDDQWKFTGLEGANDSGRVHCDEGYLRPVADGSEFYLRLTARDVPLEDELRDALRPSMQRLWNDVKPHGAFDASAEIRYHSPANVLDVSVRAEPQSENSWIEPVQFPYRLERLTGVLVYRDGHVTLEEMRAEHGNARLAATGTCDFYPDGSWRFGLEGMTVDRISLDRELVQALPNRLRKALAELNLSGPLNLRGGVEFSHGGKPEDPLVSRWDLAAAVQRASLDFGLKLDNIHGEVRLVGEFDGQALRCKGELALDSVSFKDYQFTQVGGPLWIDDQQVLLGSWVERAQTAGGPRPRPVSGRLFGGTVQADAWVMLGSVPRYGLQASLSDADLAQCAHEVMVGRQNLQGKILANLDLRGAGRSVNSLSGRGAIRLRDADIYEVPMMISLLKLLSIRRPDASAFSQSDIDLRIVGNHVYFDRINFKGDAISLLGKGEMGFDSQIQLTFHTIVGRHEVRVPLVKEIVGGASEQIMQIHVTGTLQDPQMRREAFPGVNQALQILQGEPRRN